ncbi:MAG TPA: CPBP family intramembrane glutamic endopeptidase [Thermoanaerobaculia bacterium]|nr:CPBP family intramembrane glutamic endopeptidase [Thermoanaerobaculia bacterium]
MLEFWFHLVFFYLAVLLPFSTWRRRWRYTRAPGPEDTRPRPAPRQVYLQVIFIQWFTAGAVVFVFWRFGIPLAALGLAAPRLYPLAVSAVVLAIAWAFWVRYQRRVLADPVKVARLKSRFGGISLLIPASDAEQRLWVMVSITAGVCEEVLYRGYLGFYLGRYMPLAAVAVLASVFFGLAHIYQGWRNALRTTVVGALLWGLYLATGSILPGMILHAALDIRSGQILRWAFTDPAPTPA